MFGPRLMRQILTTVNLLQQALIITFFSFFFNILPVLQGRQTNEAMEHLQ